MAAAKRVLVFLVTAAASILSRSLVIHAQQQTYPHAYDIQSVDCQTRRPENAGYLCSEAQRRCQTYAYYVVSPDLLSSQSPATISYLATNLFTTNASAIAAASNIPQSRIHDKLTPGQPLFIPLDCQCSGKYSMSNVTYTIRPGDVFFKLVNFTYEGLITCQAIMDANPSVNVKDLVINSNCTFPVRCACPNQQQINKGLKMLVTYPVQQGDNFSSIASMFGVADQDLLAANNLTSMNQAIFPSTSVLVPLQVKPQTPPSKVSVSFSPTVSPSPSSSSSSHTGLYAGIGVAIAVVVVLLALAAFNILFKRKRHPKSNYAEASPEEPLTNDSKVQYSFFDSKDFVGFEKVRHYSLQELNDATQNFSPSHLIKGAVYRGVLKDHVVAIKKVTRNVAQELKILQKVHHANLVALLGFCTIGPEQSYLVYEYAENGSLSEWLHEKPKKDSFSSSSSSFLPWKKRLQIAVDVAVGLQYIHDYTNPSYVHKDIKSSNILLDANFRGKIANFALAKTAESMQQRAALTRHIVGTQGYLAPEYVNHGLVSSKLDVFAFGVVLLEMLSGEEAIIRDEEGTLVAGREGFLSESIGSVLEGSNAKEKLKSWMDPLLRSAYPLNYAYQLAQLAQHCVVEDPKSRPDMRDMVHLLSKMLELSLEWESSETLDQTYIENPLERR